MDDRIFGGVSLFVFGDIMQMRPVMGNYIFQKPMSNDYELAYLFYKASIGKALELLT